jgi:hypothetical protein
MGCICSSATVVCIIYSYSNSYCIQVYTVRSYCSCMVHTCVSYIVVQYLHHGVPRRLYCIIISNFLVIYDTAWCLYSTYHTVHSTVHKPAVETRGRIRNSTLTLLTRNQRNVRYTGIQGIHYTPSLLPCVNAWDYPRPKPEGRHGTNRYVVR